MKNYVGIKSILAQPMTDHEYMDYIGRESTAVKDHAPVEGYLVEYENGGKANHPNHQGYISWSPKQVFEQAYFNSEIEQVDFDAMTLQELAAEIMRFKKAKEAFEAAKLAMGKIYDHITINVVPDLMDEEGVDTMKIKDIGRLQTSSDIRCNVLAKDREDLKSWLKDKGHSALISDTVNASTLKAFIKEQIKTDGEIPTDLVNIQPYSRATVVKA